MSQPVSGFKLLMGIILCIIAGMVIMPLLFAFGKWYCLRVDEFVGAIK